MNLSHLTKQRQAVVRGAIAKGYNVTQTGNLELFILSGKTAKSKGIIMFQDGSIFRTGIDLAHAIELNLKTAIKFLGI